ncbi:pyruvate dehydrogenase (acetyl-transferring) E1 component subunit alpha [Halobacteriovorax sp. GFR7]|uniref:pyruvate dehydrogenase (acetyl-transferring) E1 component subunit alpha n=1 Tax=unclassified Halobacteriovorax TaxID=2639665 RepID=UPI003D97A120
MNSTEKIKQLISKSEAIEILNRMILIRYFEEACAQQYSAGKIRGFLHLYIGEEAIASTVIPLLKEEDQFFGTYREHGHALVKGLSANSIMAEMFGKKEGCSKGRGGSMHLFDTTKAFYGGNAIVAGQLPLAIGMAMANKMQGNDLISVCFFGEGAIAEGEFHESLNLAQLWGLPVLFVCENNYYAMGTALERSESQLNLSEKAHSYKVKSMRVNGMSVPDLYEHARDAIDYVREHKQPFFLECDTYRYRAHSMFDSQQYRSKEEVEGWKKYDPLPHFIKQLSELGWVNKDDIERMEEAAQDLIRESIAYADQGSIETLEESLSEVMAGV